MRRMLIGISSATAELLLSAGPVHAQYPPEDTGPTETLADQGSGGVIPETGSDSGNLLGIGLAAAGAGRG